MANPAVQKGLCANCVTYLLRISDKRNVTNETQRPRTAGGVQATTNIWSQLEYETGCGKDKAGEEGGVMWSQVQHDKEIRLDAVDESVTPSIQWDPESLNMAVGRRTGEVEVMMKKACIPLLYLFFLF